MKMKHNKRRNTAFIFEALVREFTKASLQNNVEKKEAIFSIIKEFFNKKTILFKELNLYKSLYETRNIEKTDAEKIIKEVKRVYLGLNPQQVFDAQSKAISKINKKVDPSVFSNFVPNYKAIASISQIFNKGISPKNRVLLEREIINLMVSRQTQGQENLKINNSVLKMFSKKFNKTYDVLFEEQKTLLNKFVSSFSDNGLELKIFLNEEIARLKAEIKKSLSLKEIKEDKELQEKTKNVLNILNEFKGQYISENMLHAIMNIQNLARKIGND